MRVVFLDVTTRKEALALAPWACKIIKVCGGYMAYESWSDYETAMQQK